MIVDIINLPFNGSEKPAYEALVPLVLSRPHSQDDIYFLGYEISGKLNRYHRYKVIEHIGGEIHEHIVLSKTALPLPHTVPDMTGEIILITTKRYVGGKVYTYRYFNQIVKLLRELGTNNNTSFKTVHQVVLQALISIGGNYNRVSELEIYLSPYASSRHMELAHLSTASIADTTELMSNINNVYDDIYAMQWEDGLQCGRNIEEAHAIIDDLLFLPMPPPKVGVSRMALCKNTLYWSDLIQLIDPNQFGLYKSLLPASMPVQHYHGSNKHLYSESEYLDPLCETAVGLEALNILELCEYTDISIEIPYTQHAIPDKVVVHYNGNIYNYANFNHRPSSNGCSLDIYTLFAAAKSMYGAYHQNRSNIRICKTFWEEVYIEYSLPHGGVHIEHFDLTILSILSPVILDSTGEKYVWNQVAMR
jgi:hypothetical protein